MRPNTRRSSARNEPLVLDGRIVDGCVKLLGLEPKLRRGHLISAATTALIAYLLSLVTQIASHISAAAPGSWQRA
jgi:hypothetical protein